MNRILLSIKLLMSCTAVLGRNPVSIPKTIPSHLNSIVAIRGGAGPLNAKDVAKFATYVFGAQGSFSALAPAKANEAFGLPSKPLDDLIMKRSGTLVLSVVLLTWELVFKGTELSKAVGISAIPPVIHIVQTLLNGDITTLGLSIPQQFPLLILWSLVAYTGITGSKYADALVKVFGVANLGIGVFFYFFPNETAKLYGILSPPSTATKVQIRALGLLAAVEGIIISSLLWGNNIDPIKAVGYGWSPFILHTLNGLYLDKEVVELGLNKGVLFAWLGFHLILAGTLAL